MAPVFRRQLLHIPPSSPPGHETKALLNNSGPRYKRSKLERQMNCDVLWCVLLLVCMSLFSAVGKSPKMSFPPPPAPPRPPRNRLLDSLQEGLGAGIILTLLDPAPERSNAPFSLMRIPGVSASASLWPLGGRWALKSKVPF